MCCLIIKIQNYEGPCDFMFLFLAYLTSVIFNVMRCWTTSWVHLRACEYWCTNTAVPNPHWVVWYRAAMFEWEIYGFLGFYLCLSLFFNLFLCVMNKSSYFGTGTGFICCIYPWQLKGRSMKILSVVQKKCWGPLQ